MLGVDALDPDVARAHASRMPVLHDLLAHSRRFDLRTPADVLSSAVWPTFASRLPPGEHGIYYPMQWDPTRMELRRVAGDWLSLEPFWYDLARRGKRVTVLDAPFVPHSRLAPELGVEVLNWGSQEGLGAFHANRPELAREVLRRFGRHPMGRDVPVEESRPRLERLARRLVRGARRKGELARWLLARTTWDLAVVVFAETHRAGHVLWPLPGHEARVPAGALADVYAAVDGALGEVLAGIDPEHTTVVLFAPQGMGPTHSQEHFAPAVLGHTTARFLGEPAAAPRPSAVRWLRAAVPGRIQAALARALPEAVRDWVVQRSLCGGADWTRTPAFLLPGSGEVYLRLNVAGREARGLLDGAARERYLTSILRAFASLRAEPGHESLAAEPVCPAKRYPGARAHLLPDLVVTWRDHAPANAARSEVTGVVRARPASGRTGEHRPVAFAAVRGPGADTRRCEGVAGVEDLGALAERLLALAGAGETCGSRPGGTAWTSEPTMT